MGSSSSWSLIATAEPLDTRAVPSGVPYHIVGPALDVEGPATGNGYVAVSYADYSTDPHLFRVDHSSTGLGGPITTYLVEAPDATTIVFHGSGSNNIFEDDVIDKPAVFYGEISNSTVVDGPEFDLIVFNGASNFVPPSDNNPGTPSDVIILNPS